jgi:hypothetical protein
VVTDWLPAVGLLPVELLLLQPATRTPTTINDANKHQIILFFMLSPPNIVVSICPLARPFPDKTALLNQMLVVPLKQGFLRVIH